MPTYQYRCTECSTELEIVQKFTDSSLTTCPECSGSLRKVFNAVGVVFKGSGFYRTDSRTDQKSNGSSSSESSSGSKNGSSSDSSSSDSGSSTSESKSEKSESKPDSSKSSTGGSSEKKTVSAGTK